MCNVYTVFSGVWCMRIVLIRWSSSFNLHISINHHIYKTSSSAFHTKKCSSSSNERWESTNFVEQTNVCYLIHNKVVLLPELTCSSNTNINIPSICLTSYSLRSHMHFVFITASQNKQMPRRLPRLCQHL